MNSPKKTIVITVSSVAERSKIIKRVYTNLNKEPSVQFTVMQDQVNRIRVFHNVGVGIKVLIRTYLVIVIPIHINLNPLHEVFGLVDFHLDETIKQLQAYIIKLTAMRGQRVVKVNQSSDLETVLTDMIGDF